jgi:hypothetical protein
MVFSHTPGKNQHRPLGRLTTSQKNKQTKKLSSKQQTENYHTAEGAEKLKIHWRRREEARS